ncbi:hypothetical protein [Hymenobacter daeguensis]
MKTALFSILAAASLLTASASAATPALPGPELRTEQQNPNDRFNDRNSRDFNYGFDKNHKVTPDERKRWEEAHKNDLRDDRKDYKNERKDERKDRREDMKDARKDERKDKDFNYGFDKNHKVTPQERARWEEAHRNDRH